MGVLSEFKLYEAVLDRQALPITVPRIAVLLSDKLESTYALAASCPVHALYAWTAQDISERGGHDTTDDISEPVICHTTTIASSM
jgi:hypothetical protein